MNYLSAEQESTGRPTSSFQALLDKYRTALVIGTPSKANAVLRGCKISLCLIVTTALLSHCFRHNAAIFQWEGTSRPQTVLHSESNTNTGSSKTVSKSSL